MAYFRFLLKGQTQKKKLLFTKPKELKTELMCLEQYLKLVNYLKHELELETTLEQDLELLKINNFNTVNQKFGVIYRAERKKILHSQVDVVKWMIKVI